MKKQGSTNNDVRYTKCKKECEHGTKGCPYTSCIKDHNNDSIRD